LKHKQTGVYIPELDCMNDSDNGDFSIYIEPQIIDFLQKIKACFSID